MKFFQKLLKIQTKESIVAVTTFMQVLPEYLDLLQEKIDTLAPIPTEKEMVFFWAGRELITLLGDFGNGKGKEKDKR